MLGGRLVRHYEFIKALLIRIVWLAVWRFFGYAQVPLPETRSGVADGLENLGKCCFFKGQVLLPLRLPQSLVWIAATCNKISQVQPSGVLARHNAGPRRRANRTCSIRIGEFHPLFGQTIDIRALVEIAAVATQLGPAKIIGEDKEKIRLRTLNGRPTSPRLSFKFAQRYCRRSETD